MKNGVSPEPQEQAFDEALARGDLDAAESALAVLERDHADDLGTRVARARIDAARGDVAGARAALEALVNQHPKAGLPRAYLGSILIALGETMKGMTHLKTAFANEGGDVPAAHHAMGAALLKAGRVEEAVQHLERAADGMAESSATFFYLGQAAELLGEPAKAEAAYLRCVDVEPRFAEAWASLVRVRAMTGRLDEAKQAVDAGLEANPADPQLVRFRVQVAFDRGDLSEAKRALEDIPEDERGVEDLGNLALIALGDQRFDDALAFADHAAKRDGAHWQPPYLKGLALEGKGAPRADVVAAYEQAVEAGDPHGEAGTRLGYLLIASDAPDAERAVDVLSAAAQRNGRAPGTLLNLALAYAKLGRSDNAKGLADEVMKSPRAREHDKAEAEKLRSALS